MFKTIRTWVHSIKSYEKLHSEYSKNLADQKEQKKKDDHAFSVLNEILKELSGYTLAPGVPIVECIEAYQQQENLKTCAEAIRIIFQGNVPEIAAKKIFEYFEIPMKDNPEIMDQTAKKLYEFGYSAVNITKEARKYFPESWEIATEHQKDYFRALVGKLWEVSVAD